MTAVRSDRLKWDLLPPNEVSRSWREKQGENESTGRDICYFFLEDNKFVLYISLCTLCMYVCMCVCNEFK